MNRFSKFFKPTLTVLGAVSLAAGQIGPAAGMINPKYGVVITAVGGVSALLGTSLLEIGKTVKPLREELELEKK